MYKHILLPTDGSNLSVATIKAGVKLAATLGARVTGFYAAPPATPVEYRGILPVGYRDPVAAKKMIDQTAAAHLAVVAKAAKAAGVTCSLVTQTSDFPADAIVAAAKREKCDLIFIASHGRRGFNPSLLGSQTQRVLAQSKVPVLVNR